MLDGQTPKGSPMLRKECSTSETEGRKARCQDVPCFHAGGRMRCRSRARGGDGATVSQKHFRAMNDIKKTTLCCRFGGEKAAWRSCWLHVGGQTFSQFLFMKLMVWTEPSSVTGPQRKRQRGKNRNQIQILHWTSGTYTEKQLLLDLSDKLSLLHW